MSELYLVLRRRLEAVAEWVHIGTEEMQAAQDRLGLSNERLAPELFIVSKTWERWKARGAVPRSQLAHVAHVLGLEVESSAPVRIATPAEPDEDEAEWRRRLDHRLLRIEEALGIPQSEPDVPPSGKAANGG